MRDIWDIVTPKDNWERNLARMEYARLGLATAFAKKIRVKYGKQWLLRKPRTV